MTIDRESDSGRTALRVGWVILASGFCMHNAMAQTCIEAGYVNIQSDNEFVSADWGSVDEGRGGRLAINHDHGPLRLGFAIQRLDLDHSNSRFTEQCNAITLTCRPVELYYEFTDKYRFYEFSGDWKWQWLPRIALRAGGAVVHETWSNSGGIFQLRPLAPPAPLNEDRSTRQTTWAVRGGAEIDLVSAWKLSLGLNFQQKAYRAVVRETVRPLGQKSLLEGIARLTRRFGDHVDAFVEYRPSDQRHYASAGLGYRF